MKNRNWLIFSSIVIVLVILILKKADQASVKSIESRVVQPSRAVSKLARESSGTNPVTVPDVPHVFDQFIDSETLPTRTDIEALVDEFSLEERQIAYQWIRQTKDTQRTLFLKDALLNQIEAKLEDFSDHLNQLSEMAEDKSLSHELRGYLLQHIQLGWDHYTGKQKKQSVALYRNLVTNINDDTGGTAFLNLVRVHHSDPTLFQRDELRQHAENFLSSTTSTGNLMTVLAAVKPFGLEELRPQLIKRFKDPELPSFLFFQIRESLNELNTKS